MQRRRICADHQSYVALSNLPYTQSSKSFSDNHLRVILTVGWLSGSAVFEILTRVMLFDDTNKIQGISKKAQQSRDQVALNEPN
jgi:hypothetical protein